MTGSTSGQRGRRRFSSRFLLTNCVVALLALPACTPRPSLDWIWPRLDSLLDEATQALGHHDLPTAWSKLISAESLLADNTRMHPAELKTAPAEAHIARYRAERSLLAARVGLDFDALAAQALSSSADEAAFRNIVDKLGDAALSRRWQERLAQAGPPLLVWFTRDGDSSSEDDEADLARLLQAAFARRLPTLRVALRGERAPSPDELAQARGGVAIAIVDRFMQYERAGGSDSGRLAGMAGLERRELRATWQAPRPRTVSVEWDNHPADTVERSAQGESAMQVALERLQADLHRANQALAGDLVEKLAPLVAQPDGAIVAPASHPRHRNK